MGMTDELLEGDPSERFTRIRIVCIQRAAIGIGGREKQRRGCGYVTLPPDESREQLSRPKSEIRILQLFGEPTKRVGSAASFPIAELQGSTREGFLAGKAHLPNWMFGLRWGGRFDSTRFAINRHWHGRQRKQFDRTSVARRQAEGK